MDEPQVLDVDVVVVGAGPAGVTVALELARAGRQVVLLPGGGRRESAADRDLHRAESLEGPWGHEPLEENRRRGIGGASALWGGRCVPLDPIDFVVRDWVPDSGWPLTYDEYWSWAQRACDILDVGPAEFRRLPPTDLVTGEPLAPAAGGRADEVGQDSLERWSAPFRFARLLRRDPHLRRRAQVLPDAHAVCLLRRGDAGSVDGVRVRQGAREIDLRARTVVLAAGGLENARLMLHSGFGATLPALGRYYMTHTVGSFMSVRMAQPLPRVNDLFREQGRYLRHRWRLEDAVQREARVGGAIAYFARAPRTAPAVHHDLVSSGVAVAKLAQDAVRSGPRGARALLDERGAELRGHARTIAAGDAASWGRAARLAAARVVRSLPTVLPHPATPVQHLTFQAEHLPHRDSAVTLGTTTDAHGVPRLKVRVELTDGDFDTVLQLHRSMEAHLHPRGGTPLTTPEEAVAAMREDARGGFNSHAHHLGTTRMGTSPTHSVVDADSRVHGVANLYVAGSSIFPTGGHANPTLSIVMLAARLGHHLAQTRHA